MPNLRLYNNPWSADDCGPFVPGIDSNASLTRVTEALLGRGSYSSRLGSRPTLSFNVAGKAENSEYLREGLFLKAVNWGVDFVDNNYTEWILKDISRGFVENTPGDSIRLVFVPLADHLLDSYTIWPQQGATDPPNDSGRESVFRLVDTTIFGLYSRLFVSAGGAPYSPDGATPMFQRPSDANTWDWRDESFTLEMAGATVGEILDEVAKQTGLRWYYSKGDFIGDACSAPNSVAPTISKNLIHFEPTQGSHYAVPSILTEGLDFNDCGASGNEACGENQSFRPVESDWELAGSATMDSYEGGIWVPEWGANDAKEIQLTTTSISGMELDFGNGPSPWSGSVYIKNTGSEDIRVFIGSSSTVVTPGESRHIVDDNNATFQDRQIRFRTDSATTINFIAWRPQILNRASHHAFNVSCAGTSYGAEVRKVKSAGADRSLRDRFTCLQPIASFEEITRGVQGTLLKEIDGTRVAQGGNTWVEIGKPFTAVVQEDDTLTCFGPVNNGFPRWVRLDSGAEPADIIPNDGDFVGEDVSRVWSCISTDGSGNEIVEYLVANHEIIDTESPNRLLISGSISESDPGCVTFGMNSAEASSNDLPQKICTDELVNRYGEITRSEIYENVHPLVNLAESRDNGGGDPTFGRLAMRPQGQPSSGTENIPDVFDACTLGVTYGLFNAGGAGGIYGNLITTFLGDADEGSIISFNNYSNVDSNQQNNPMSMWFRFKVESGLFQVALVGPDDSIIDTGNGPLVGDFGPGDDGSGNPDPFWREIVFATSEKVDRIIFLALENGTQVSFDAICITNAVREIPYQSKMGPNSLWQEAVRDLRAESERTGWDISGIDAIIDETDNTEWWNEAEPGLLANVSLPLDVQRPDEVLTSVETLQITGLDFEFAPSCAGQPSIHPIRSYSLGDPPADIRNYIGDSLRFRQAGN